ncbi:Formylglycine-generating sulfatase enzyme [compost metagenome]
MLKALQKHDKDSYAYIPSGSFDYNGQTVSVQAFYMGTTEVTNFEYRTFLFDLLIQNKKDEFLHAKPNQEQWNNLFDGKLSPYAEHYFSDKAYDEFPVVNISRTGAELYCRWLSEELRKFVGEKKEDTYNDVRLPLRVEWVKAASNEGKMLPYPWGGPYLRNSRGLLLANYTLDTAEVKRFNIGPNKDLTAPSRSYFANEYGLYNLSGNVAEIVYENTDKTEPGTAGGSWKSNQEEVKIYAPDPYKGSVSPQPTIGFRVVSTYLIVYQK